MAASDLEDIEIRLLLEGIHAVYGYDFRHYARASLKRRLKHWLAESAFDTLSCAQSQLLRDKGLFTSLLQGITVNVTEMFRDPAFFKAVRDEVVPFLRTYPFVRIWVAGCATGEEAYSMAILLEEEGMAGRYRIYGTDINEAVLQSAREAIIPMAQLESFARNYRESGGRATLDEYFTACHGHALLCSEVRKGIVFAPHDLAVDADFGEMNLVMCRNVMIYFQPALKERCLGLFDNSLGPGGFLCLGMKETLERERIGGIYDEFVRPLRVYRKRYDS